MMNKLVPAYSILMEALFFCLGFAPYKKRQRWGLNERVWGPDFWRWLEEWRLRSKALRIFFCSSAGEYEQAKPLIDEAKQDSVQVLILFFSCSGVEFADARHEPNTFMLTPPDSIYRWRKFFAVVGPAQCVVVRHELWPGFLLAAKTSGSKLYLVNAASHSGQKHWLKNQLKAWLLAYFDRLFLVSDEDRVYFKYLGVESKRLEVIGDSKFDRASRRRQTQMAKVDDLKQKLLCDKAPILIGGSIWEADFKCLMETFEGSHTLRSSFKLILAPHKIDASTISIMQKQCAATGSHAGLLSQEALWKPER